MSDLSKIHNHISDFAKQQKALDTASRVTALDQIAKTLEATSVRNVLADFEKQQKQMDAALGRNALDQIAKTLEATSVRNVLADFEKQQKQMDAALGRNALDQIAKTLEATSVRNVLADFEKQQKQMDAALGHISSHSEGRQPSAPSVKTHRRKIDESVLASVSDLGVIIRQKRKDMGLTQQHFADIAGVGRRFICELEAGKATLEFGRVLKVCQAVGIDLAVITR